MNDTSPASIATTYFDALGRGDIPTVMAQFADDVVWRQPGARIPFRVGVRPLGQESGSGAGLTP